MSNASFLTCLGLAVSVSPFAIAQPLTVAGRLTDTRVERTPVDLATPREGMTFGGEFVTMRDELENFPLDTAFGGTGVFAPPTSFTGPSGFQWPLNGLRGQPDNSFGNGWVRIIDLSSDPAGGANGVVNASKALRIKTITAQTSGILYQGASHRFGGEPGEPTLPLAPTADHNARVSAELYLSTIDQMFTFEPGSFTGFITGRLLWGGYNNGLNNNLPVGPVTTIYSLGDPVGFSPFEFRPVAYCTTREGFPIAGCVPPPGFAVGDGVPPPIANWSRFVVETTSDGRLRYLLDLLDGSGEVVITDQIIFTSSFLDRLSVNTSYEAQDAFMLIDNIEASGPVFALPKAPALECPYLDDMEWLDVGPLRNQNPRWDAALSSGAIVNTAAGEGQVIRQVNNVSSDNHYRREMSTALPPSNSTITNDLVATVRVSTTLSTVRGFAVFDGGDLAARVFFGREDPDDPGTPFYQPSIYVQIDPAYEPIDEPDSEDPRENVSVVGVDVADTNHDWQNNGQYRTLEMRLSANGALRVSIEGQRIYAGDGAFTNAIDRFAFESENNTFGESSQLRINDVTLNCNASSCAADFDFDDVVAFPDLNAVLSNFGATGLTGFNPGDADGDGAVNFADLNAVLAAYGTSCE